MVRGIEALVADLERPKAEAVSKPRKLTGGQRQRLEAAVELCVAAQGAGLLAMRWAILCPRCRGAKSQVTSLHELPRGVHCQSCNIDYERDF